jgi:choline dehydrogenase
MYGSYGADYIGWEKLPEPYRSNLSSTAVSELAVFPAD